MTDPRHVAIDLRPLARGAVTGVGLIVTQILEELPSRGWSFVGVSDRPVAPDRLPGGIPVEVAPGSGGRIRWEEGILPRLLRRLRPRPDLYHATWNHGVPGGLPFPAVLSLHDLIPWRFPRLVPWPRPAWIHRTLYRRAVRRSAGAADVLVTLSEASRRDIDALVPEAAGRSILVPCAVPRWHGPATPGAVAAWRARFQEAPYWVYFGGFDPRKGVEVLLRAMDRAFPERRAAPLLVLAGAMNREGERLLALGRSLGLALHAPGYVPDAELAALLGGCGLFVYPSLYEGFGIPPLLALAVGAPCVVSDGGALPEVVGDAGVVTPAGDIDALAATFRRVAAEPDWIAAVAARGPERAREFSVEALAERMSVVYAWAATTPL